MQPSTSKSIAITGASGLIGSALSRHLQDNGHRVLRFVRRPAISADEISWDPRSGHVDTASLVGVDAVVHLAGAGVGDRRWTPAYKREILESRTQGTTALAAALAGMSDGPRVLISGSAIGFYGDTATMRVDESGEQGEGFLADVVAQWEAAAAPAVEAGVRVAFIRTGLVATPRGGAFGRMLPLFRLGLGGPLGGGRQFWSLITLTDEVRAIAFLLDHDLSGPFNLTAPDAPTNAAFTKALGRALRRPAVFPVPGFALRLVLGEFSSEVLGSARVHPQRLLDAGFTFSAVGADAIAASLRER